MSIILKVVLVLLTGKCIYNNIWNKYFTEQRLVFPIKHKWKAITLRNQEFQG